MKLKRRFLGFRAKMLDKGGEVLIYTDPYPTAEQARRHLRGWRKDPAMWLIGPHGVKTIVKKVFVRTVVLLFLTIGLQVDAGCDNWRARTWGGSTTVTVQPGHKVVTVTWKESSLWIATRPMHADEAPETILFEERSSMGVLQGTVTIVEQGAAKP